MSRETLQESLSALMDNEANELEVRRVLAAEAGGDLDATWSRYQVARAALHREPLQPGLNLAAAVSAAIADEPALVPVIGRSRWHLGWARAAVAASVTLAVLAGVRLYNQDQLTGPAVAQQSAEPVLVQPQAQGPAVLAGYSAEGQAAQPRTQAPGGEADWLRERYPHYLQQHARQSAAGEGR